MNNLFLLSVVICLLICVNSNSMKVPPIKGGNGIALLFIVFLLFICMNQRIVEGHKPVECKADLKKHEKDITHKKKTVPGTVNDPVSKKALDYLISECKAQPTDNKCKKLSPTEIKKLESKMKDFRDILKKKKIELKDNKAKQQWVKDINLCEDNKKLLKDLANQVWSNNKSELGDMEYQITYIYSCN